MDEPSDQGRDKKGAWDGNDRRHGGVTQGRLTIGLWRALGLIFAAFVVITLAVLLNLIFTQNRRSVTLDALSQFQLQQQCINDVAIQQLAIQNEFNAAVSDLVAAGRDPEKVSAASAKLEDLRQKENALSPLLHTLTAECYKRYPLVKTEGEDPPG